MTRLIIKRLEESLKKFAQVRQQSKEISDRLLKRTKCIAKEELRKLENNDNLGLKQIYNGKIMEVQQKYQEDMADIGQAHMSAALEPDHDALIKEQFRKNQLAALKRGKEAMKQMKNIQQMDNTQQQRQERLHQVREIENFRSTMVANLPKKTVSEENTICISIQNETEDKNKQEKISKKMKKHVCKKSPGKTKTNIKVVGNDIKISSPAKSPVKSAIKSPVKSTVKSPVKLKAKTIEEIQENDSPILEQQSIPNSVIELLPAQTAHATELKFDNKTSEQDVQNIRIKDKTTRYNPDDYVQTTSDSTNSDSSSSFSDDSSYFSDSGEQYINRETKTPRYVKCPATDKVHLYDHKKHHSNVYDQPTGVVEKIQAWDEPSAMDLAQEIERAQTAQIRVLESRKHSAKKRGEDAVLREKVRRDYQTLMQHLDQLTNEERKLKASQVEHYPKDTYVQEERRKILRDQHKTKLNRALKTLLNEEQCTSYPVERQITLTPRNHDENIDDCVNWEESCCFSQCTETSKIPQNKCKENGISREEQILDMLKKVERQKRLLLQEFGADLPNDIFNASIKPLFERDKSVQTQSPTQVAPIQKPISPEITVINASFDEKGKKDKTDKIEEKSDISVKKVEIAVQTMTGDKSRETVAQDKGTQVELVPQKESESTSVTDEIKTITDHYPIEPKITVIRAGVDSSESTSSETINGITDIDEESPEITHKKKKYVMKTSKPIPTKMCHKSCSTRPCKPLTPTKKYSKFLSKSQYSSPRKCTSTEDVPSKKIRMYVDKSGLNIKVQPPPVAEIAVDVNTQSTQVYSTGTHEQQQVTMSKQQWIQSKSKRIKIKDVSDSSTSFASPPPAKPKDILEALSNNISILELLDSSTNESLRLLRRDVSPVSTPETPSPRTMKMPSNIPDLTRIKKLLRYPSTDTQTYNNDNNNNINNKSSSTKNDYSTSTDVSQHQQNDRLLSRKINDVHLKVPASLGFCLCNNPDCKQEHTKFDEIRNYALKNCPQILQKYEDLQTTCAERIISLTHLIEKVRNEQRGMEMSMIDPSRLDETSLMQLPEPRERSDLENVHKLVENIEAIHNQLAKTLIESQRIIKSKAIIKEEPDQIKETQTVTPTTDDNVICLDEQEIEVEKERAKPKIINEEKVNIQLNRFKVHKSAQVLTSTPEHDTKLMKHYEEELIEKISKEILEQSEGFNNNNLITSKEISTIKHSIQTSTDNDGFKSNISRIERNDTTTRKHSNKESKRIKDFVPMLTDPKVSKAVDNLAHSNGRSKPPVSLLSGPYRPEIESSGHELSTIIEFDTPDTVNKSQSHNARSPLSAKKVAESQITKSTAIVKPSEHIASSLNLHNQRAEKLCNSSVTKLSLKELVKEASIFLDSPKTSKNIGNQNLMGSKNEGREDIAEEMNDRKLQRNTVNQKSSQIEELQLFYPSTDANNECKDNKDKITSTSSNSFSELSGVSQIASTPSSTILKYASSPEEMEIALKKLGLGWAITTLKKTREASALSSSSNSDVTPMNTAKRISPVKKQFDSNYGLPDFSDVSSISIKEASKSTEQAVLLKGRTSTPKLQNSNSNSERTNSINTNISENFQEPDNGLIISNISLTKTKSSIKKLENL